MGRAAVALALVAVIAGCGSGSASDERSVARAYAQEFLSDGCNTANLTKPCRITRLWRIGAHLWRAKTDLDVGPKAGHFPACVDVDVKRYAVFSNSTENRFHGAILIRCKS